MSERIHHLIRVISDSKIDSDLSVSVFPDEYWVQTATGWLLCHSERFEQPPIILGVVVPHLGGGGCYAFISLYKAGMVLIEVNLVTDSLVKVFDIHPNLPKELHNRFKALSILTTTSLDTIKGKLVTAANEDRDAWFIPWVSLDDVDGDWSLL